MKLKRSIFRKSTGALKRIGLWVSREFFEYTILLSALILAFGLLIVVSLYSAVPELQDGFWPGVFIEFNGMLFDVVVFGILIAFFVRSAERRWEAKRQQEIIDDYKKWEGDEAKFRIAGAIRRLIRSGRTDIDFGGIELSNFSFRGHDIKSIKGSTFYDGTWGEMGSWDRVSLEEVDFSHVDCREVTFSKFNPFVGLNVNIVFALIKDCSFTEADLSGAIFNGAHLTWTMEHPAELGIWHEFPGEPPYFQQTHYPPFSNANLKRASFIDARFKNADFREAEGILACDFTGAKGLETCLFDNEKIRDAVLSQAKRQVSERTRHRRGANRLWLKATPP